MKESTNIVALMVKDHCKIEQLIEEFEANVEKDYPVMMKSFNKFEWNLEKHIFVEEKAIFTCYNPEDVIEGYKMLPQVTKQHNVILNELHLMRRDIRNKRRITNVYGFKEFLIKHKNFEEKDVYPKLDQALNDQQKQLIAERIKEII
ncbi:MAG: hemerythrin domain-containing protein [Thermoplasmatales archaeon]|nr:MAG: hemerythrin domain-containing protein [Thermoplasmatales archaeon]